MIRRLVNVPALRVCNGSAVVPLMITLRNANSIKIANRRRVESFVGCKYIAPTRLATAAPQIAEEWDYDRNPGHIYPKIISVAALARYWWKCRICSHSFEETTERRVLRGRGCPKCEGRAARNVDSADISEISSVSLRKKRAIRRLVRRKVRGSSKLRTLRKRAAALLSSPADPVVSSSQQPLRSLLPGERSLAFSAKRAPLFTKRDRY